MMGLRLLKKKHQGSLSLPPPPEDTEDDHLQARKTALNETQLLWYTDLIFHPPEL
jgi:hypothetical protein